MNRIYPMSLGEPGVLLRGSQTTCGYRVTGGPRSAYGLSAASIVGLALRGLGAVGLLVLALSGGGAVAQTWPVKPVRVVVPYPAGQGTDVATRYLAEQLSRSLGQNFVVENRPGAGGNIGTQQVARAPADGYALLMGTNGTHAASPFLYQNPGFDPVADFDPVALIGVLPLVFVAAPGHPVDGVSALISAARARPGALNVAYTTTTSRSALELLQQKAGAPLYGVAYKGSAQAIADVVGGQVDFMVDTIASLRGAIAGGRLKALGVTSVESGRLLPGIRSVAEQGIVGFDITGWNLLYAPRGTPVEAIRVLADAVQRIMALAETQERLLQLGIEPLVSVGDPLARFVVAERDKWGALIRASGIKAE